MAASITDPMALQALQYQTSRNFKKNELNKSNAEKKGTTNSRTKLEITGNLASANCKSLTRTTKEGLFGVGTMMNGVVEAPTFNTEPGGHLGSCRAVRSIHFPAMSKAGRVAVN